MAQQPVTKNEQPAVRPHESLIEYLQMRAAEDAGTVAFQIAAEQLDQILAATTEEDMLSAMDRDSIGGRDLEDVELSVESFTVHTAYAFQAPLGHFVMIHATRLDTAERLLFDTSSPLLIGVLRWYEAKNMFPKELVIRGAPTPRGRRLWFEKIPERKEQATAEVVSES